MRFAGLMFGLAVGCRPHFVLICGIVLGAFAIRERRSAKQVLALAGGMVACGILLAWYNDVRFENPLKFGRSYQLTSLRGGPGSSYQDRIVVPLFGRLRRRDSKNDTTAVRAPVHSRAVEITGRIPNDAAIGKSAVVTTQGKIVQVRKGVTSAGGA